MGLGEQSLTFITVGVDGLVISTNLLHLDRRMWGLISHPQWGLHAPGDTRQQYYSPVQPLTSNAVVNIFP